MDDKEKGLTRDCWADALDSNDRKDQPCLGCGAVMISKAQLDEAGHLAVNTLTEIEFQAVEGDMYFKCQTCGAKNFVDLDTGANGLPQLKFTCVKP